MPALINNIQIQIDSDKKLAATSAASLRFFDDSVQNKYAYCDFEELLKRKQLDVNLFKKNPNLGLTIESDIAEHAKWVYKNIYSVAYPNSKNLAKIRPVHGIQHVCRVALLIPVFANLNRKHGDKEAEKLTEYDLKLLQIAALFHDSAREDDGVDKWDHESALLLYKYLTTVLSVDSTKAKQVVEAVANKDPNPANGLFEIIEPEPGKIAWRFNKANPEYPSRSIYQELLHDADCLDIIRARLNFEAQRLYFYKNIIANRDTSELDNAFEELAELIVEARSLIHHQGDSYLMLDFDLKRLFEKEEAFTLLGNLVDKEQHPLIYQLKNGLLEVEALVNKKLVDLTAYDPKQGITEDNLRAAMREGLLLARAIEYPSAHCKKNQLETVAQVEGRKASREVGIKTETAKADNLAKQGSPFRSASVIGYGGGVFSNAGFLIVNPKSENFWDVSAIDVDSGHEKKGRYRERFAVKPLPEVVQQLRSNLLNTMKLGGEGRYFEKHCFPARHTEIQYDITSYDAVYYTNDPTLRNKIALKRYTVVHPLSSILQAIYIRKQYETQLVETKKKFCEQFGELVGATRFFARFGQSNVLPLFEYSGMHNQIKAIPESALTDEKIIQMWVEITSDFMKQELEKVNGVDIDELSVNDLKVLSVYRRRTDSLGQTLQPADASYSPALREIIDIKIESERKKLLENVQTKQLAALQSGTLSPLSQQVVNTILKHPQFVDAFYGRLVVAIEEKVNSGVLFQQKDLEGSPSFLTAIDEYGDLPEIAEDLEHFLRNKAHTFRIFRELEELKLLILCERLGLVDLRNTLNQLANDFVVTALKNRSNQPMDQYTHSDLETYEKLILLFNLAGECVDELEKLKQRLFDYKQYEWVGTTYGLQYYLHFIQAYQNAGWLTDDRKKSIRTVCERVRRDALSPDSTFIMADIDAYLRLIQICGMDSKPYAKEWLQQSKLAFTESVFLARMANYADFDDEITFGLVINKISSNQMHFVTDAFKERCSPWGWIDHVEVLKNSRSKGCFSDSQLEIVQNRFNAVCDRYLADFTSSTSADFISDLMDKMIDPLHKLDAKLTFPDNLLAKFNTELTHLIDEAVIDEEKIPGAKQFLNQILQIHEQLGVKDGREVGIQTLMEKIRCSEGLSTVSLSC